MRALSNYFDYRARREASKSGNVFLRHGTRFGDRIMSNGHPNYVKVFLSHLIWGNELFSLLQRG